MMEALLDSVEKLHRAIRSAARDSLRAPSAGLASVEGSGHGDVSYGIDGICERLIDRWFAQYPPEGGAVVICEGLGQRVYPKNANAAKWRIIIDPLDGTRHIMFDNRSAWILTGIARNKGVNTALDDICAAVQTEVPTTLQDRGAVLRAVKGEGAQLKVYDLKTGGETKTSLALAPSGADTLRDGFCVFSNFFPGTKVIISELEERVLRRLYGEPSENAAPVFSEQYISSAGQLFMLMTGKYRVVVDVRALLRGYQRRRKRMLPLCVHPYDLSAALIATEAGCIVRDMDGAALNSPLDLHTNCAWAAYANAALFEQIHPIVREELKALAIL